MFCCTSSSNIGQFQSHWRGFGLFCFLLVQTTECTVVLCRRCLSPLLMSFGITSMAITFKITASNPCSTCDKGFVITSQSLGSFVTLRLNGGLLPVMNGSVAALPFLVPALGLSRFSTDSHAHTASY